MNASSGYIGWSMSRRAAAAYANGLAPLSKIGSSVYIRTAARLLGPAEWHHTSKRFNRTDFYNVAAVRHLAAQLKAAGDRGGESIARKRAERRARRSPIEYPTISRVLSYLRLAREYEASAAQFGVASAPAAELRRRAAAELTRVRQYRSRRQ